MHQWQSVGSLQPKQFACGYCGRLVASDRGFFTGSQPQAFIYVCPNCGKPSFFYSGNQSPGVVPGNEVAHLPAEVSALYNEARRCVSASAPTSAVLACRKLLMSVAVAQGAKEGGTFLSYVEYLADKGYVPPNGRGWVDHIRLKGNEATHEIKLMTPDDASELISFAEMLLKFVYEFPNRVPQR